MSNKKESQTIDSSGRIKQVKVHDVETGTLKKIGAKDADAFRRAIPPTHLLEQNVKPRKAPRD
jgi:hypothetical protein